jgi:hypothetical protein
VPFVATPIALPADLYEVRAGDTDLDGREELVLVSRVPKGRQPDAVRLTLVHLSAAGAEEAREVIELGQEALLWDIQGGLWAVDGDGARALQSGAQLGGRRTALGGLGPTTPTPADVAADPNRDGIADVLVYGGGRFELFAATGTSWGAVKGSAEGALRSRGQAGGTGLEVGSRWPAYALVDVDGDGRDDLVQPEGDQATVAFLDQTLGARTARLKLPLDLEPRPDRARQKGEVRREIEEAWLKDFDHDGKMDLLVHQWVVGDSWFGATAELVFAAGTGAGFRPAQTVRTSTAAVDVTPVDWEGDGDIDLVVPLVDIGLGNLGRALVSRKVQVDLALFEMGPAGLAPTPKVLRSFNWPITNPDAVKAELERDVTGDGVVDLVLHEGEGDLKLFAGGKGGMGGTPAGTYAIPLPPGDKPLFVRDLTGDGRAEVLVWGPEQGTGTLLRWK